jgi:hypothetical protein
VSLLVVSLHPTQNTDDHCQLSVFLSI